MDNFKQITMSAGRPPKYKNANDLEKAIDKYFNEGVKKRQVVVGRAENREVIEIPVPTITGLCHYIGFESRQSFYAYEDKPEFSYTIKRARLFIEKEYEEQLQVGNISGAIFALKNMGWTDKSEVEQTGEQTLTIKREVKVKDDA